jgi:hypothetical protein
LALLLSPLWPSPVLLPGVLPPSLRLGLLSLAPMLVAQLLLQ